MTSSASSLRSTSTRWTSSLVTSLLEVRPGRCAAAEQRTPTALVSLTCTAGPSSVENVLRDLASLNKVELLPWDLWGVLLKRDEEMNAEDWALVDHAALAAQNVYGDFEGMQALYQGEAQLRVPQVIQSWVNGAMQTVDVNRLES